MALRKTRPWVAVALLLMGAGPGAETPDPHARHKTKDHGDHAMMLSRDGMVMNHNPTTLPRDCAEVSGDSSFTVSAGMEYATAYPGTVYGMSEHEFAAPPCSRITVTFVNKDQVRHQWMVHGLPRYLYPGGMFHLEAAGGATVSGSFIVPGDQKTYQAGDDGLPTPATDRVKTDQDDRHSDHETGEQ